MVIKKISSLAIQTFYCSYTTQCTQAKAVSFNVKDVEDPIHDVIQLLNDSQQLFNFLSNGILHLTLGFLTPHGWIKTEGSLDNLYICIHHSEGNAYELVKTL